MLKKSARNSFLLAMFLSALQISAPPINGLKYIECTQEGVITITQPLYPKYKGAQNWKPQFKTIGPIMIMPHEQYPYVYQQYDPNEFEGPFDVTRIELVFANQANPFEIVPPADAHTKPYSSCGRLKMTFHGIQKGVQYGSAAAIDKNLVITAAHNVLPPILNGQQNIQKVFADEIEFHHMLTTANIGDSRYVRSAMISTHCFLHPKWIESFDPKYDVALIFLSESLDLNQEQLDRLLKLRITNENDTDIRIVGHPHGTTNMSESQGKIVQTIDAKEIIYHLANTLPGSSGSPIVGHDMHLIGIHTCGGQNSNSGVRMREDLLPFIDDSIDKHQNFLKHGDITQQFQLEERRKEQERKDQELVQQGMQQGIQQGIQQGVQLVARQMLQNNMAKELVINLTGLTPQQVDELIASISNEEKLNRSRKRPREE